LEGHIWDFFSSPNSLGKVQESPKNEINIIAIRVSVVKTYNTVRIFAIEYEKRISEGLLTDNR